MKLVMARNYQDISMFAAQMIIDQIRKKSDSVLGLATGITPIKTYEFLIKAYNHGSVDFKNVKTVNLDEYVGLSPENKNSYYSYMQNRLFNHININPENTFIPDGLNEDAFDECENYERMIHFLGGIDMQLLGLGQNGHIGFNEPSTLFQEKTHYVKLDEETLKSNAVFFEEGTKQPKFAYTMGIGTILKSKKIVMLVNGKVKADILYKIVTERPDPLIPATALKFHRDVTIIADKQAMSVIKEKCPEKISNL